MAERTKATVLKTVVLEMAPGVRIPLPPHERIYFYSSVLVISTLFFLAITNI